MRLLVLVCPLTQQWATAVVATVVGALRPVSDRELSLARDPHCTLFREALNISGVRCVVVVIVNKYTTRLCVVNLQL